MDQTMFNWLLGGFGALIGFLLNAVWRPVLHPVLLIMWEHYCQETVIWAISSGVSVSLAIGISNMAVMVSASEWDFVPLPLGAALCLDLWRWLHTTGTLASAPVECIA